MISKLIALAVLGIANIAPIAFLGSDYAIALSVVIVCTGFAALAVAQLTGGAQ